jgi:hypothetical protein
MLFDALATSGSVGVAPGDGVADLEEAPTDG